MMDRELALLAAVGQLETHIQTATRLAERLGRVPLWQPAGPLAKQAAEAQRMMEGLRARMDRRLVVTLVGPCGAGKSTLLNALAGVDDLSPAGHARPTTRGLVVFTNDAEAAAQLLGPDATQATVRASQAADLLRHMLLVDTPDTDSQAADQHRPLILRAVAQSDILLCVFDAQNPKRRDHADFMVPLVQRFHGASLVAVLNQVDRLGAKELTDEIAPEFQTYLRQAWDTPPQRLLLVSARRHLQRPQWEPQAGPRHDLDQFDELHRLLFDTFGQPGFGPDRRLANARQIGDFMAEQVRAAAAQDRPALTQALALWQTAEQEALTRAVEALRADDQRMVVGVHARLYQMLAQRWTGPVGWMIAIWSRLILFGTGLAALVRWGNPLTQLWGLVSAWRRHKEIGAALETLGDQNRADAALTTFQQTFRTHWPDIAEQLVAGRFDPQVRRQTADETPAVTGALRHLWAQTLEAEIERSAKTLSGVALQLLFNLPSVVLLVYVGWLTAASFLGRAYLSGDFFLHALLTIAIVLLLSFFALQILVRLALRGDRLQGRALQKVQKATGDTARIAGRDISEQVSQVLALNEPG
jgi:energy-coupling factor transporter ATP-binding protein EcfA2